MSQQDACLRAPSVAATEIAGHAAHCRFCGLVLRHTFVDLGMSPLCQTHIELHQLNHMEPFYPLHVWVCHGCFLVQLEQYVAPAEIFSDYAYFSSFSDSWVEHARRYTEAMTQRFGLGRHSKVMEIASNDGYLLQHFVRAGIACLGIEPAANVAAAAVSKGIPTTVQFFGVAAAQRIAPEHGRPDLLLGNNVLAHVPDINDFVAGMKLLLGERGVITMEFPHLQQLMEQNQFDTIYHEHFSYLSFTTVERIFARHGLTLFDVEELPTHGGSLRIFARHANDASKSVTRNVVALRERELAKGFDRVETYSGFREQVLETKRKLLEFLIAAKRAGKTIVGYGAPGKGNTLLNYCGIRQDFLDYTVDRSPHKQGRYTPGTHIPILHPDVIAQTRPDYILLLPWNLEQELREKLAYVQAWGGKLVVPIPQLRVLSDR
ncbi:MAG TPA: class I SAM-dependent methyltransferase [Steroidobacteraceae bacterium]|nr:class I SAM-dependent methyltransferase [Steroidobacteraceae bacterium]